jgi:hypothetical protein
MFIHLRHANGFRGRKLLDDGKVLLLAGLAVWLMLLAARSLDYPGSGIASRLSCSPW